MTNPQIRRTPYTTLPYIRGGKDRERMLACLEAEATGDVAMAYQHYRAVADHPDPGQAVELWELRTLLSSGIEIPGWVWSRWAVSQAYRWLRFLPDPRLERIGWATVGAAYSGTDIHFPEWPTAEDCGLFQIAVTSWVARQIGTYEYGGLATFLQRQASPSLLDQATDVRGWVGATMAGYRLEEVYDGHLVMRDLRDDASFDVLNLELSEEVRIGECIIGRLAPVSVWPGLMFESRPVAVDVQTALDVASCGDGDVLWLTALWRALDEGRMPLGFDLEQKSLISSDLSLARVREELAPRVA